MASVVHNENKINMPVLGVIFIIAVIVVCVSHFSKLDFGIMGIISWVVVIVGAIYFVLWALFQIFG